MKKYLSYLRMPLLIVVISIPLILPFLHKGYFPTHDGEWAVVRLADMYREVKDGQLPARFSGNLNFSYGYPLFHFAYPLPYYLGVVFYLLHFGMVNSIKLLFLISVPVSGLAMYFLSKRVSRSELSGMLGAMLYMYLPYRMVDLYVRGSLGESVASIFFPLIFLSLIHLKEKTSYLWSGVLAISFAAIILAHNIMATYAIILIAFFVLATLVIKKQQTISMILSSLLGLGLSAFFWLPALVEKKYILLSQIPIADRDLYFVPFNRLIYSTFGYGTPTDPNPFTYQLGIFHLISFIIAMGVIITHYTKKRKVQSEKLLLLGAFCLFIFLLFPISSLIWEKTPLLKEINYPWTLLLPLGFVMSLFASALTYKHKLLKTSVVLLLVLNGLFIFSIARPEKYVDFGDGYYFTNDATTTSSSELMPLTVTSMPTKRPDEKVEVKGGVGSITILENKSQQISFKAMMQEPGVVRLNTIYFPGWKWFENNREVAFTYANTQGVMEAPLSKGEHTMSVKFINTPIRSVGNSLSLLSLIGLAIFMIWSRYNKRI